MEISYTLKAEDYVNHQLYLASKSDRIKKSRLRSWVIATLAFASLAGAFYLRNDTWLSCYFLLFTVLSGIFFPLYTRRRYRKHYESFVRENYQARFDEPVLMTITEDRLLTKDKVSESALNLSELAEIVEVPTAFYLRVSVGQSLIFSKQRLKNPQAVKDELLRVATQFQIPYINALNWEWN